MWYCSPAVTVHYRRVLPTESGKEDGMSESTNGSNLGSGTVAGLMAFLDWVIKKNYGTPAAITPLKSASKQIFETVEDGGDYDQLDVRELDREEYLSRFQVANQATGRIRPESVRAYRNRFNRALDLYHDYLTTGGTPKLRSRSNAAVRIRTEKQERHAPVTTSHQQGPQESPATDISGAMISYPFPLESGEVANLRLPKRLESRDAARLTAFINALIFEPQKQLGAGRKPEGPEAT
jgi:hypothetical protein